MHKSLFGLLSTPLTNEVDARNYLVSLVARNRGYHPDSSAADAGCFTAAQAELADIRMVEVRALVSDAPGFFFAIYQDIAADYAAAAR